VTDHRTVQTTGIKSIDDIRRDNLRFLVETRFAGNQSALARALNVQSNWISRLLGDKRIGDRAARRIEQACGKPRNWLDVWHGLETLREPAPVYESADDGPHPADMLAVWAELPPAFRQYLLVKARVLREYVAELPPFVRARLAGPTAENLHVWEHDLQDEMDRTIDRPKKAR
jgi:hypothetical protein